MARSIINCNSDKAEILSAIKVLYSKKFQDKLNKVKNPYGSGGASMDILDIIKNINLDNSILKKEFYDLDIKWEFYL